MSACVINSHYSYRDVPTLLKKCRKKAEWTQIVGGFYHAAALTEDGKVFTWGNNDFGQLGHGDKKEMHIPTKVESLDGFFIAKIACGGLHTVFVTDRGEVYTWYVTSHLQISNL